MLRRNLRNKLYCDKDLDNKKDKEDVVCGCSQIDVYLENCLNNESLVFQSYDPNNVIFNKINNKSIMGYGTSCDLFVNQTIVLQGCSKIFVEVKIKDVELDFDLPICATEAEMCAHGNGFIAFIKPIDLNVEVKDGNICGNIPLVLRKAIFQQNNDTCHCNLDTLTLIYEGFVDSQIALFYDKNNIHRSSSSISFSFMGKEIVEKCNCKTCVKTKKNFEIL